MTAVGVLWFAPAAHADNPGATLAVVMTNDPMSNQIKVYDAGTRVLLQTLSTHGRGGVGGNARGVKQYNRELFAVVNNGSNSVAVYRREGNRLRFDKLVTTTSAPVSVDFGNDHMYVAGATTVDSFALHQNTVEWLDGTSDLPQLGMDRALPPRLHQPGQLHGDGRTARHNMTTGDELERCAAKRERIDTRMGIKAAVFVGE